MIEDIYQEKYTEMEKLYKDLKDKTKALLKQSPDALEKAGRHYEKGFYEAFKTYYDRSQKSPSTANQQMAQAQAKYFKRVEEIIQATPAEERENMELLYGEHGLDFLYFNFYHTSLHLMKGAINNQTERKTSH